MQMFQRYCSGGCVPQEIGFNSKILRLAFYGLGAQGYE